MFPCLVSEKMVGMVNRVPNLTLFINKILHYSQFPLLFFFKVILRSREFIDCALKVMGI